MEPSATPLLHGTRPSNKSIERTAARCALSFFVIKTRSVRFTRVLGGGRPSLSR
jgi:hypothetical protein